MYPIQRPKLGFLIKDISSSELAYNILRQGSDAEIDSFIFFENVARPCIASLVPCAHISEAFIWDGPLIATCIQTAYKLIQMYGTTNKYFFLNDLEWMRIPFQAKQFSHIEPIYRNKDLKLICRSEQHKQLTELTWNRKVSLTIERYEFFNPDNLKKLMVQSNNLYPSQSTQPIMFNGDMI